MAGCEGAKGVADLGHYIPRVHGIYSGGTSEGGSISTTSFQPAISGSLKDQRLKQETDHSILEKEIILFLTMFLLKLKCAEILVSCLGTPQRRWTWDGVWEHLGLYHPWPYHCFPSPLCWSGNKRCRRPLWEVAIASCLHGTWNATLSKSYVSWESGSASEFTTQSNMESIIVWTILCFESDLPSPINF